MQSLQTNQKNKQIKIHKTGLDQFPNISASKLKMTINKTLKTKIRKKHTNVQTKTSLDNLT